MIELLTVIVVVGLVAGMIIPAAGRVKARAEGLICLNNLHQWGVATQLFATDNDDLLPRDGSPNGTSKTHGWYIDLPRVGGFPPYHSEPWRTNGSINPGPSPWICPSNPRRSNGNNLFHYCLNQHVNSTGAGNQARLSSIHQPERVVWLFDNGRQAAVAQFNNVHPNLHSGGAQFVFLDGHAARFPSSAYWDDETKRGKQDHPDLVWFP